MKQSTIVPLRISIGRDCDMWEQERYIRYTDGEFPEKLRQIRNSPEGIYVRGALPVEDRPTVAIIGARRCSTYGKEMAEWFAGELAAAGVQVVSGMAAGVDGIAQREALRAGGRSFGVLGCGTDICYPAENRDLYESLQKCGGILSEYAPGTPPDAFHFPMRNRIISGLADIVVVVEAQWDADHSGFRAGTGKGSVCPAGKDQ